MPRAVLRGEFPKVLKEVEEKVGLSFNKDPNLVMDLSTIPLASKFGVSEDVIRIRLERDGLKK